MSAGAGREQLSLQQAGEALQQWHSRPCLIVVTVHCSASLLASETPNASDTASGFERPLPPSGATCSQLGSWLPARLGVPMRVALAVRSPFLTAWGRGGGTWRGATGGSGLSCAEAVSGKFAQRRGGSLSVSSPVLRSSTTEVCCPRGGGRGECPAVLSRRLGQREMQRESRCPAAAVGGCQGGGWGDHCVEDV